MRALMFVLAACGSPANPVEYPPLPGDEPAKPTSLRADRRCIAEGVYTVKVDLSEATISQVNTGMPDTRWCESLLQSVADLQMSKLILAYEHDRPVVLWGARATTIVRGSCELEVTSPPMPARIVFAGGSASGTSTYTVGTKNHPDESCTATNAKLEITTFTEP